MLWQTSTCGCQTGPLTFLIDSALKICRRSALSLSMYVEADQKLLFTAEIFSATSLFDNRLVYYLTNDVYFTQNTLYDPMSGRMINKQMKQKAKSEGRKQKHARRMGKSELRKYM